MKGEIVERAGRLFMLTDWDSDLGRPVRYRLAWPTGLRAADWGHLIGRRCRYVGEGAVEVEGGVWLTLEHGAKTHPDPAHCIEEPIRKPRGAREYRDGRWIR
ncbi:hypothetical protein EDC27_0118 [Desulfosoma caldarium]|uniref:Uncharacterized protein n=1 Tax=Desulfosoma caldarium TaxID=610254 RepID=A0A3N1VT49_9BACT|nr:hypothetical protein EDC27_0118 [Desulfosoma caldarium]